MVSRGNSGDQAKNRAGHAPGARQANIPQKPSEGKRHKEAKAITANHQRCFEKGTHI